VVTSKQPKKPISEAMKEGDEPLRSFSDLLQFYEAKRTVGAPVQHPEQQLSEQQPESENATEARLDPSESSPPSAEEEKLDTTSEG
jgi:hypothetical protein